MNPRSKGSILVVDDEPGIRETLTGILEDEGYEVESAADGEACLERLAARAFPVVLLDIWLPGIDGLETLERITKLDPSRMPVVIMISGHGNIETAVRATKLGAFDFLEKPLSIAKVTVAVRNALDHRRLAVRNREFEAEARSRRRILGDSIPMKALRQQIDLMAPTNGRALIFGESGSGKELVARALHAKSKRSQESFVVVNCAAIPEESIESELFGHAKGAFAGAGEDKIGKFQQADGGSLFLDEVGDMSLKTQSKVLRSLDEQRFEPVGSGRAVQVDVRVIAATNKDLEGEIERGNFREDLFYRLNVVPFYVPPLRERVEDVPVLAQHFFDEFARAYGRRACRLPPEVLEPLTAQPWPGNVRELRNLMERIVIMNPQGPIGAAQIPLFERRERSARAESSGFTSLEEARKAYERDYVLRTLESTEWNVTRAAAALGLERSHLYRKMKALGIRAEDEKD